MPKFILPVRSYLGVFLLLVSAVPAVGQSSSSRKVHLGIIVSPTLKDAQRVVTALRSGKNFFVLAKEESIDPSAASGGYLGLLAPNELRPELKQALIGLRTGELSPIVHLPTGYAVLEEFAAAPPTTNLTAAHIAHLVASGVIHIGPSTSGLADANHALLQYAGQNGWHHHQPQAVCDARTQSLSLTKNRIEQALATGTINGAPITPLVRMKANLTVAELYSYTGNMRRAIEHWNAAYALAPTVEPAEVPAIEETLGVAYLHLSAMENNIFRGNTNLDYFPPLDPHAHFPSTRESKIALGYFQKYLAQFPQDLEVRWLLNLTYATLGEYPSGVPAAFLIPEKAFRSPQNIGRFIDVAPEAGLNVVRNAGGALVDDFDNDGLLDIIVSSQNECDPVRFFHNNGDGTFTDVSKRAGLDGILGGLNLVEGDYNNDGCMDFLVLRGGWSFPQRMTLMRNNCNGTFTDVTDSSGLGSFLVASQSAAWADIDNDGFLDLFVANEHGPARLFHNNGNGTFTEIGKSAGVDRVSVAKGITAADFDHDGYMDFYVSNQDGPNFLYHNEGNLTFKEIALQAGVQAPVQGFATWAFDYDNDGWPDLFVASFLPSVSEVAKTWIGGKQYAETLRLYRNNHDGTFKDVTKQVGLDKVYMPMGSNFGDVDNDGYLDIYLGNGAPSYAALIPHILLRNDAGKSFVDITQSSGTGELDKGHGISFADLTRRGSEDIVAVVGGAVPGDRHTMRVYQNPGNRNNWINVRLIGVRTNREALGAVIHVTVRDGSAPPRSIYRTVGQTSSFGGNPMEQNIGLGPHAHDITLDIWWPTSKTRQHFTGIAPDQYLQIKEFAKNYTRIEHHPFRLGGHLSRAAKAPVSARHGHL